MLNLLNSENAHATVSMGDLIDTCERIAAHLVVKNTFYFCKYFKYYHLYYGVIVYFTFFIPFDFFPR